MSKINLKKKQTPKPKTSSKVSKKNTTNSTLKKKSTQKKTVTIPKKTKNISSKKTAKKAVVKSSIKKSVVKKVGKKNKSAAKTQSKKITVSPSKKPLTVKKNKNSVTKTVSQQNKIKKSITPKSTVKPLIKKPVKNNIASKKKTVETKNTIVKKVDPKNKSSLKVPTQKTIKKSELIKETIKPIVEQKQKEQVKEITTKSKGIFEPKGKFELEFVIHSSPVILFEFLVSPSGLSEWFCDDVNIRNDLFTFFWDGTQQVAKLVKIVEEKLIRFEWVDKKDGSYFEFRIEKDELTNDISLIVTDFAENDEEKKSSALLWNSQIDKLLHVLGSYF